MASSHSALASSSAGIQPSYGSMNIKELKEELRKRGAKTTGRKKELVERLECYDRNFNFGHHTEGDSSDNFTMSTPEATTYKDINMDSKIPSVTEVAVKAFQMEFDKSPDGKPEALYYGRFLQSIRYSTQGDDTYIAGSVAAEMKKTVTYKVDIKLDAHGVLQESQCECSVGLGPEAHCKHVLLVLFALSKRKDGILTKQTCTQVLQTFHQTKKYDGSPLQMSEIKLRQSGGLMHIHGFDPRPVDLRNTPEYPNYFRNIWLNSQAQNIPIRQLYPPANIRAFSHDHDYFEQTHDDFYLQQLSVTSITESEHARVEKATRGQHTNKVWKEERTKRLHASNFGKICKAGERTDFVKMAKSFTKISDFTSKPTTHGHRYEPVAVEAYTSITGNVVESCGIHVCEETPYLGCSPDGLIGQDGILEVKCPYTCKDAKINAQAVPYVFVDNCGKMALKREHNYFYQVQGNLLCTKRQWCDFVVWTLKDCQIIHIPRDDQFIEEIRAKLRHFFLYYFREILLETYFYKEM